LDIAGLNSTPYVKISADRHAQFNNTLPDLSTWMEVSKWMAYFRDWDCAAFGDL